MNSQNQNNKIQNLKNKSKSSSLFLNIFRSDFVQEFLIIILGAYLINLAFKLLENKFFFSYDEESPYPEVFCSLIVLTFFIILLIINQPNSMNKYLRPDYKRNIILFCIFNYIILYFLFYNTYFPFGNIDPNNDNWFRTSYIVHISNTGKIEDFAYKDKSGFYPPLYWLILGYYSRFFGIKPYKTIKLGFLIAFLIFPLLLYHSWRKIYREEYAFLISVFFFSFIANYIYIDEVDHLLSFMLLVPYFIYFFENYNEKSFKFTDYILAGFIGSLLFCSFYIYFLIIPIYYTINLILDWDDFKKKIKRIFMISIFIILFSLYFILPLFIDLLIYGFESHQNLSTSTATGGIVENISDIPFDYFKFNLFSLLLTLGVFFLITRFKDKKDINILGKLLASVYLIFLIGYVSILLNFPIMGNRFLVLSNYILLILFCHFFIEVFNYMNSKNFIINLGRKDQLRNLRFFSLILIIFWQNYQNITYIYNSDLYEQSLMRTYPEELVDTFEELDYEGKIFLTNYPEITSYLYLYLFVNRWPEYSHPSALHNERVEFLERLSSSSDSEEVYDKIKDCKYDLIDYIFLERINSTHFKFLCYTETFSKGHDMHRILFAENLFNNSEYFKLIEINNAIIYKVK